MNFVSNHGNIRPSFCPRREHHIPQANYVQKLKIFKNVEKLLGKTSNISQASAYRSNIVSPENGKLEVSRDFKENV
jgi:hypothetical protein